jgi:hypothetical protein
MTEQLDIFTAIQAGERAAQLCFDKADRIDPEFKEKAKAAILAHLRAVGQCSGEDLVDVAIAMGARPHEPRAFGQIFRGLLDKNMIFVIGYGPRRKGHGCIGAKIYALCHSAQVPADLPAFLKNQAA